MLGLPPFTPQEELREVRERLTTPAPQGDSQLAVCNAQGRPSPGSICWEEKPPNRDRERERGKEGKRERGRERVSLAEELRGLRPQP